MLCIQNILPKIFYIKMFIVCNCPSMKTSIYFAMAVQKIIQSHWSILWEWTIYTSSLSGVTPRNQPVQGFI